MPQKKYLKRAHEKQENDEKIKQIIADLYRSTETAMGNFWISFMKI